MSFYKINLLRNILKIDILMTEQPDWDEENDKNKTLDYIKEKINLVQEWYQIYKKTFDPIFYPYFQRITPWIVNKV